MTKRVKGLQTLPVVFSFIFLFLVPPAFGSTALEAVETNVNAVLNVLRDPALKDDSAKEIKEKKLWSIADTMFDYPVLSKRTLGKNWERLDPKQQEEFTDLFSTHVGNVYMDRILAYSNEKVVFDKEKTQEDRALVNTRVMGQSKEIPVDYRMVFKDGGWKVYDVVIEGVSLVENYRSQFKEILKDKSPEYLLETLREKTGDKAR
jgi:phospholipid transport system substrate-binding protein